MTMYLIEHPKRGIRQWSLRRRAGWRVIEIRHTARMVIV